MKKVRRKKVRVSMEKKYEVGLAITEDADMVVEIIGPLLLKDAMELCETKNQGRSPYAWPKWIWAKAGELKLALQEETVMAS